MNEQPTRKKIMAIIAKRRGRYIIDGYDHTGKRQRRLLPKGTTESRAKLKLEIFDKEARRKS